MSKHDEAVAVEETIGALLDAFGKSEEMDRDQRYLSGGHRFETLDLLTLNQRWITAIKDARHRRRSDALDELSDLYSELKLRGEEAPIESVRDEINALADMARYDPEHQERVFTSLWSGMVELMTKTRN